MSRQARWLEAIERRISATSAMLGSMKGIKMTGLKNVLFKSIHTLRIDELNISKGFRRLLIWNMGIGMQYTELKRIELTASSLHISNLCSYHHVCRFCYSLA